MAVINNKGSNIEEESSKMNLSNHRSADIDGQDRESRVNLSKLLAVRKVMKILMIFIVYVLTLI